MHEDAPPLRVWVFPVLAIAIILISFFSFTYSAYGPYANVIKRSNENLEASLAALTRDTTAISIVILGSSMTEDAIENPQAVEKGIFEKTNKKVNVLRVALYHMNMDIAKRIDFFKIIRKFPPQYLFIENFGMNLNAGNLDELMPIPVDASLLHLRNEVRQKIGASSHDNYYTKWYTFDTKPLPDFYSNAFDSTTFKFMKEKKMVVRKPTQNEIANDAYEALRNKTRIIFLDFPQSDKLERNFLDNNAAAEFQKVVDYYQKQYDIQYWPYTGSMSDSCFIDGVHLNYKGSKKYQEWFVSEFAAKR
ncbi:MAG: hypothetical protein WKF87_09590 [Chryseolinea sp.]